MKTMIIIFMVLLLAGCSGSRSYTAESLEKVLSYCSKNGGIKEIYTLAGITSSLYVECNDTAKYEVRLDKGE